MTAPSRQPPSEDLIVRTAIYLDNNRAGGNLHVVAEDGDMSDSAVQFCAEHSATKGDTEANWIATEMLKLSKSQRLKLVQGRYDYGVKEPAGASRHECFLG